MKTTFKFLLLATSVLFAHTCFAQIAIVAGIKSTATAITRDQASALFLGKSTQLPGAGIPVLIDQVESVDARQIFYTKVTEKTPAQVKRRHHIYVALFLASTIPHRQLIRSKIILLMQSKMCSATNATISDDTLFQMKRYLYGHRKEKYSY